jgi:uncharacterized repeat protein (TIGR01451 family)/fimbrial isopeptide formation D2 family protein
MTTLIRRQAFALKNLLLKALLPFQEARSAARDVPPPGEALSARRAVGGGFGRDRAAARAGGARFGFSLLFLFALLTGASSAQAAGVLCSDFTNIGTPPNPKYLIDGADPAHRTLISSASTLGIDADCTIRNFPASNPLQLTLINFNFEQHQDFIIVFDNVTYVGGMSCQDPTFSDFWMWWVNGSYNEIDPKCQEFLLPVDAIQKLNPVGQTTATVGVPFTYTLTMPVMMKLTSTGYVYENPVTDDAPLSDVRVYDDLTKTGANLSYVGNNAYLKNSAGVVTSSLGELKNWGDSKHLEFRVSDIPPNTQLVIELTVVLDNANTVGTQFTNTATWTFDKTMNGIFKDDLPGQNGTTFPPMTVVGANLVVEKTSTVPNLNVGTSAPFKINVQNTGGSDAWDITVTDNLPAGMCQFDPRTNLTARIYAADGVTLVSTLALGTDYTLAWTGSPTTTSACQLTLTTNATSALAKLRPTQRLIINYDAQLDAGTGPGLAFTNVAGATQWFNAPNSYPDRLRYGPFTLSADGTPSAVDYQDAYTLISATQGYFFLKSVEDLTTGANPATTAFAGDKLRYTLQIQNFTLPALNNITITDELGALNAAGVIVPGSLALVGSNLPASATLTVDSAGGPNGAGAITISGLNLGSNEQYQLQFDVTLAATLTNADVSNQASLTGTDEAGLVWSGVSDDPYSGGPELLSAGGDVTTVTVRTPGPLSKANPANKMTATIGEQFTYTITVPKDPVDAPLYDVRILDDLTSDGVDMRLVSATLVSGGTWTLSNTSGSDTNLVIEDAVTGIDIPAGGQAVIEITVELLNTSNNNSGQLFANTASYTYNRANGVVDGAPIPGGGATTDKMTVVEPAVTAGTKTWRYVGSKASTAPAEVGDVIEYVINVTNTGNSTAFDTNIGDILPAAVSLVPNSATAVIGGNPVTSFVKNPTTLASGALVWGRENGDGSLDIPPGGSLVLTYQVTVLSVGADIDNSVYVDWTSLDGANPERTGVGCQSVVDPLNDYCFGPVTASVATLDTNAITKSVLSDSYGEVPPSTPPSPSVVRVGDTATYQLTLKLHEGVTRDVRVSDLLPDSMQLQGAPVITTSAGAIISYTALTTTPTPLDTGATGKLVWSFGDITNTSQTYAADGTDALDELIITYVASVIPDPQPAGVAHVPTINVTNFATLSYTGGDPSSADPLVHDRLTTTQVIEIRQPVISAISKTGEVLGPPAAGGDGLSGATAYQVDIVNNTMKFRLRACNTTGLAPAYNVLMTDQLPVELNEGTLVGPVVKIGTGTNSATATPATPGPTGDYVYTLTGRQMSIAFNDSRAINPGECVFVEYELGFNNNIAPNTTWNNSAQVQEYYSLPTQSGRAYGPVGPAAVYMTNLLALNAPTKAIALPASPTSVVTIGEEVQYTITVPGTPVNATLTGVVVSDLLDPALVYLGATAQLKEGVTVIGGLALDDSNTAGQSVNLTLDPIPAGQQAVITLRTRVADNSTALAGYAFDNAASYVYNGETWTSAPTAALTVVEPALVPTKSVSPASPATPTAGDILTYTITLPAQTGANTSQAFDLSVRDTLGAGLSYVDGSATISGVAVAPPLPEPAKGTSGTQQTLTWAGLDIPYNTQVTITYDVAVSSSVVPGQTLSNSAVIGWTSLDTDVTDERTYSATVATSLTAADSASLTKAVSADGYDVAGYSTATDRIVRVGDTVDYQLTLNLQEGTTPNVSVTDQLPAGLAFVELVSVVPGTNVSHGAVSAPSAGATGLLAFSLGDVVHTPDADALDSIVITYRARVLKDTLAHQATIPPLTNAATLSYTGASVPTRAELHGSVDLTVLQPVVTSLTKTDRNGLTSPANIVDIANTTMAFRLHACNSGAAPAYSLEVTDQLATQFDETSISIVGVSVAGAATGNYVYTLVGRTMTFVVNEPVYPNQCVDIDYDIGFNTDFGANQTPWNNAFTVSEYWSLQAPTTLGQLYAPVVLPVPFVMTNNATTTPPTKSLVSSAEATIGGEVIYRIAVPGAVSNAGVLYDVAITDTLDPNLDYISATVTGVTGTVSDTSTQATASAPSEMKLSISEIQPGEQAVIELHARVRNVSGAQQGVDVNNTVSYTYANTSGGPAEPALTSSEIVTVNIVEPHIATIAKSADKTTATAGELVRYTVTLTASGGADASDVFDVTVTDTLAPGLEYAGGAAVSGAGNTIGSPGISGDGVTTPYTLVWSLADGSDIDIAKGTSVTISYDVRVLDSVLANQALANSVVAQWTSIDGALPYAANTLERNGADGIGQLNDYVTPAATWTVTTPDTNTITKERSSDTYAAGDANVRIGDTVEYTLRLSVQEGTLNNLVVVDTLPQGLEFAGIVSVNGDTGAGTPTTYTAAAPFVHGPLTAASVAVTGAAATGPTSVTWSLGSVTNQLVDGASNEFVIVYRARVLNNVFAHSDLNVTLSNAVNMSYDTATGRVTQSAIDAVITVLQPSLTVSKSAASSVNNDTEVVAGEVITYTVDIVNSGTAPAYDTRLQDTLPVGLRLGGVATSSIALVNTATGATVSSPGPVVPAYDLNSGVAVWDFDNSNPAYTIPVGQTLRVTYTATVDSDVGAGLTLTNTAQATNYYSLDDDDASPADSGTYREAYASTTATSAVTTPTAGVLSKATPAQTSAAIGEEFTYTITVPATPIATALQDVRIFDNLAVGGADLRFVRAEMVSPSTGQLAGSVDAATGVVEIENTDGSGIDIPAMGQIQVAVTVVLLNTGKNLTPGLAFTNRAWYTYSNGTNTFGSDATTGATSGAMTVAHPTLTMRKTGPAAMQVGTPATFTLDVQNTSTSDAWNVTVTDWLPNPAAGGMCDAGVTNVSATIFEADGTTAVLPLVAGTHYDTPSFTVSGTEPRCEFVLTTKAPAVLAPGQRLIVTYSVALDADNIDGSTQTNVAGATQWLSANPAGGVYQTYSAALTDGTVGTLDHQDAYSVTVQGAVLTFQKSVTKLITDQSGLVTELPGTTASPGDRLRYTITVENTTNIALSNFSLVDQIDRLNALPMFQPGSIANVSVPAGANAVITGGTLNVNGLNVAANETLTVVFEATLAPVIASGTAVLNQAQLTLGGTVFGNSDDPAITGTEDPTRTLITSAPQFQVLKTSDDTTGDTTVLMAGDTLRYTITAKNIGTENATGVALKDLIPAYTTYVANSTRLNGVLVADSSVGVSPLQGGMLINAPENTTPGAMRADASATPANVATVTFDVVINSGVLDGTPIANQGFVSGSGAGSGPLVDKPSDDPATPALDDPTRDIVGKLPLLDAQKIVSIQDDKGTPGAVDSGDVLRYTITVNNFSAITATGVVLTDAVPANTTYVADSVRLNGVAVGQPDGGVSPLIAGVPVNSPGSASGTVAAGASAVVIFDVLVNADVPVGTVPAGTVISNQGYVASSGLPAEPTDADGIDTNGDQPTTIVVGSAQQLLITKEVFVVDGGAAQAGAQLEYVVRVTNTAAIPATNVVITDDLTSLVGAGYVAGSARLNGLTGGVNYTAPVLTASVGDLPTGASATLSFRVLVDGTLPIGSTLTNTAKVTWSTGLTANSSVSIDIGGIPGSAMLNGHAWHDTNFNNIHDTSEVNLAGWTVALYRNNVQLGSVTTDIGGLYSFGGVAPSTTTADQYELRFTAPGATAATAKLGLADSTFSATPFTDGLQQISNIAAVSGSNLQNLNLPIDPNGVVFDSVARAPIAGATVTMARAGSTAGLPSSCFDDPVQQNQVTLATGFYKFDLNYSDASCPRGGDYVIRVTPPGTGYVAGPSRLIPPVTSETTAAYDVASCSNDAVTTTASYCEAQVSEFAPAVSVPAAQANHYLHMTLSNPVPEDSQLFNNHIAVDPTLENAVTISKTSALVNVSRGELVPYVITVTNTMTASLQDLAIVDTFPPGFKYVEGSSRVDGLPLEPVKTNSTLSWGGMQLDSNAKREIKLLFIVGSGVSEGQYVNRAQMFSTLTGSAVSAEASATVRVVPDPTFDCTDVIGKVFDDVNRNGYQDEGEKGLPGVRVATARGLLITTDDHGRFHITCAVVPDEVRGSNFILKVDDRTLPTGYRITTENPRVQRATRGKMMKFNFGATIHKLVRIDVANGVFEPGTTDMRIQWKPRMDLLMGELKKGPSTLRLAYMAEIEDEKLVDTRLKSMKQEIERLWALQNGPYELVIETEVFWRTGAPPSRSALK